VTRRDHHDQTPTIRTSLREIAADPEFWRGVLDAWHGKPLDVPDDSNWAYERGRCYVAACRSEGRAPLRQYVGDKLNENLVRDLAHYFDTGAII
jgi:hypothetical protein